MVAHIKSIFFGIAIGVASSYLFSVLSADRQCVAASQQADLAPATAASTAMQTAARSEQSKTLAVQQQAEHPSAQQAAVYLTLDVAGAEDTKKATESSLSAELTEFVANNPMYFTGVKAALKYNEYYIDGVRELSSTGEKNEWATSYENGLYNETKLFSEFLTNQELQCNIKVCVLTGETNSKNTLSEIQEKLEKKDLSGWGIDLKQNENGAYTFYFIKNNNNDPWPAGE